MHCQHVSAHVGLGARIVEGESGGGRFRGTFRYPYIHEYLLPNPDVSLHPIRVGVLIVADLGVERLDVAELGFWLCKTQRQCLCKYFYCCRKLIFIYTPTSVMMGLASNISCHRVAQDISSGSVGTLYMH